MPTDKRQRHKVGRAARREAAIAEMRRRQRRRRVVQIGGILLVVLLVAGLVSALGGDDETDVASEDTTTTTAPVPELEPPTCEAPADGAEVDTSAKPEVAPKEGEPPTELQCTDIVVGDGEVAEAGDTAEMQYVGVRWSNGEQFDASWDRGETFPVSPLGSAQVIQGWNEGILGMKVGGRREIVIPPAEEGGFRYGTGACPPAEKPAQRPTSFTDAPQRCLEDGVDYSAEVVTSEGAFVIDLHEDRAPGTVNNFVVLARSGWFDGDDFHRVVPGFVNQAGDPVGDPPGTGGPGYTIPDELGGTDGYPEGAVAMAKTPAPDSAGSQWFVCVDCSTLPLEYSVFGQVTEGLDVVRAINALGQADQAPSRPVAITSVEIREA